MSETDNETCTCDACWPLSRVSMNKTYEAQALRHLLAAAEAITHGQLDVAALRAERAQVQLTLINDRKEDA